MQEETNIMINPTDPLVESLREKYTDIKPCCVEGSPDAHTAWLKVGDQSFCVTDLACDTEKEAEWFRTMLASALATIVRETIGGGYGNAGRD